MSTDLTPDQKATVKNLFAEIAESEAKCASLIAGEKSRQAELITKLHAVAGPRPYAFEGKTVTPVVRAKKGSTTGEKEAFLRGRTVPEVTSLD